MPVLTLTELMRLTWTELCARAARLTSELPKFPDGSPERQKALVNLRNIRSVLARLDYSP